MPPRPTDLARGASQLDDPEEGLRSVAALRRQLDGLEAAHVEGAVRAGWPWSRIAEALGVSKQAAHKKHAPRVRAKADRGPVPEDERAKLVLTGQARRSVRLARQEAELLGQRFLGTEHLLLGLLAEGRGPAFDALDSLGVTLPAAREVVGRMGAGAEESPPQADAAPGTSPARVPITTGARQAMEQSLREAVRLASGHLGVEHILLALLRAEQGAASRALVELGASTLEVEQRLTEVLAPVQAPV